jgi:hypothetical protein
MFLDMLTSPATCGPERAHRNRQRVCPQTGRRLWPAVRRHWLAWVFSGQGLLSLLWFLVRVVPKPSRASYPCQRVAFPLASGFVVWVVALLGAAFAWRKARRREVRFWRACLWGAGALAACAIVLANLPAVRSFAANPPHGVLGVAGGVCLGRVAWVYAPQATSWAGFTDAEHWYASNHTDLAAVEVMLSKAIQSVGGTTNSDAAAWTSIFTYFNTNHGKLPVGYQPGEKIGIKINLTTCSAGGTNTVDTGGTYEKQDTYRGGHWLNSIDVAPQLLLSLLRQLVYTVGVNQTNIFLGDPTANFPKYLWDRLHPEFPLVHYFDNLGGAGRMRVELSSVPFCWSVTNQVNSADAFVQDYIPVPFAQADYLIDAAVMKTHSGAGITVCAKNFYGALLRCPNGYFRDANGKDQWGLVGGYADLHKGLPNQPDYGGAAGLGHYRNLVDLLGHPQLGGKTLLFLVDALYCGQDWSATPVKWNLAPFSGNWPSSLLASQDPVAIDSVCYDFLYNEWPDLVDVPGKMNGGAEDYLHEAAQADNPASGTFYDPGKTGSRLSSLGVHEHWNDSIHKQYSRNLDPIHGQGIELVQLTATRPAPVLAITNSENRVLVSWPASLSGFNYQVSLRCSTNLADSNAWFFVTNPTGFEQGLSIVTNELLAPQRFYRLLQTDLSQLRAGDPQASRAPESQSLSPQIRWIDIDGERDAFGQR